MGQHHIDMHLFDEFDYDAGGSSLVAHSPAAPNAESMLKTLSTTSEEFAYGTTVLATALQEQRRVVIAANLLQERSGRPELSSWECTHDTQGVDLRPLAITALNTHTYDHLESGAIQLVGNGVRGDAMVVCDPFGDNELLLWALRVASHLGVVTIAITTDQPNLLAALANHAVRVPAPTSKRQEFVMCALRHLVQTAGVSLVPARQRATGPLRSLSFTPSDHV